MAKILLIEDDAQIAAEVAAALADTGYTVRHAGDGTAGLAEALHGGWDLLIVDRLLPGLDGLDVIRRLRADQIRTPALILSALGAIDDRVVGLRAGGDDYLIKPFALAELSARLEALLRRPANTQATLLRVGPLELDLMERKAWRGARKLELLMREFKILEYMMRHEGQVVTRAMLLEAIWNYRCVPNTNLVDVHMGRLRRKVDQESEPPLIANVRGAGFVLRAPA
jgi:two-component system OmpR family response regulator